MTDFWTGTPYWYVGVYIGGVSRGCVQPNLTPTWVDKVDDIGYGFIPIWVGLQTPCANFQNQFSRDPATARNQGETAAANAADAAWDLGFRKPADSLGSIIYYDLEGWDDPDPACVNAAQAFIRGWVIGLHNHNRRAGVYGGDCRSHMDSYWQLAPDPDDIWIARGNGFASVYTVECIPDTHWDTRRFHQYVLDVYESHGGTTLKIDRNCAWGQVSGRPTRLYGDIPECYAK